jgi:hypothetical protein
MFRLTIQCPETGKAIRLKMVMDQRTFLHATFRDNRTLCPHCQQSHLWQKANVTLIPPA